MQLCGLSQHESGVQKVGAWACLFFSSTSICYESNLTHCLCTGHCVAISAMLACVLDVEYLKFFLFHGVRAMYLCYVLAWFAFICDCTWVWGLTGLSRHRAVSCEEGLSLVDCAASNTAIEVCGQSLTRRQESRPRSACPDEPPKKKQHFTASRYYSLRRQGNIALRILL